ncbi:MAG: hypothetical protein MJ252_21605, partial [archaeon]|nr:hypothetical protein [archaeon]
GNNQNEVRINDISNYSFSDKGNKETNNIISNDYYAASYVYNALYESANILLKGYPDKTSIKAKIQNLFSEDLMNQIQTEDISELNISY